MMAEPGLCLKLPVIGSEDNIADRNHSLSTSVENEIGHIPLSLLEKGKMTVSKSDVISEDHTASCVTDTNPQQITEISPSAQDINKYTNKANSRETDDTSSKEISDPEPHGVHMMSKKDEDNCVHAIMSSPIIGCENTLKVDIPCQTSPQPTPEPPSHDGTDHGDEELARRAQEDGTVDVVFPGTVTQEGCCRFVSEILKCVLYQRQQLPMTYDQLVYTQKEREDTAQSKEVASWKPVNRSTDLDWRKCQRTLQDLEDVLQQLEALFSLSLVPRVLLLLGGSLVLPKEMLEINMEALVVAAGDRSLRVSACLRQLFRTLFVADLLSDAKPVRLMATTVLVLAHRDCGVEWFRPKLDFKVPTRVRRQIIALSSDAGISGGTLAEVPDMDNYIWFQAPTAIKGFSK